MGGAATALFYRLQRARKRVIGVAPADRAEEELPLRAELYGADQMEQHGRVLAASHQLSTERVPDQLLARLADNERVLVATCDLLTATVKDNRRITPAGEW